MYQRKVRGQIHGVWKRFYGLMISPNKGRTDAMLPRMDFLPNYTSKGGLSRTKITILFKLESLEENTIKMNLIDRRRSDLLWYSK